MAVSLLEGMIYHERNGKGDRGKGRPSHPQPLRNRVTHRQWKRIANNPPQSGTLKVMRDIINQGVHPIRENLRLVVMIDHSAPKDAGEENVLMVSVRRRPGINQGLKACHPHKRLASFERPDEHLGRHRRGGEPWAQLPKAFRQNGVQGGWERIHNAGGNALLQRTFMVAHILCHTATNSDPKSPPPKPGPGPLLLWVSPPKLRGPLSCSHPEPPPPWTRGWAENPTQPAIEVHAQSP